MSPLDQVSKAERRGLLSRLLEVLHRPSSNEADGDCEHITPTAHNASLNSDDRAGPPASTNNPVDTDNVALPTPGIGVHLLKEQARAIIFGTDAPHIYVGHFRLNRKIGSGGMGTVFEAYDLELGRKVALKQLHDDSSEQLVNEAKALALVNHPNIVQIHEVVEEEGRAHIIMEYVEGETLRNHLNNQSPTWREIVDIFKAAGRGLVAVHAKGMVHGDFKPDNVMIGEDGRVRVTDFGLAHADHGQNSTISAPSTESGRNSQKVCQVAGTLEYMAPEQFKQRWSDAGSDQFSFCVTLHEALYGERPFRRTTAAEKRASAEYGDVRQPPPDTGVPAWLHEVVTRGLLPEPQRRFESMQAIVEALDQGDSGSISSKPPHVRPSSRLRKPVLFMTPMVVVIAIVVFVLLGRPPVCLPVLGVDACVIQVEEPTVKRAWTISLTDGAETELRVEGMVLHFKCTMQRDPHTVIVNLDDNSIVYWTDIDIYSGEILRIDDSSSGIPTGISAELELELRELIDNEVNAAGSVGTVHSRPNHLEFDLGSATKGETTSCGSSGSIELCKRLCDNGDANSCIEIGDRYAADGTGATIHDERVLKYDDDACGLDSKIGCRRAKESRDGGRKKGKTTATRASKSQTGAPISPPGKSVIGARINPTQPPTTMLAEADIVKQASKQTLKCGRESGGLSKKIGVQLMVGQTGKVSNIRTIGQMAGSGVAACVEKNIKAMVFSGPYIGVATLPLTISLIGDD